MITKHLPAMAVCVLAISMIGASDNTVQPPKTEAELPAFFRVTWDQEVLPEKANPRTMEKLLARGQVILMNDQPPGGIPWMAAAGIMVDAPVQEVFDLATDFENYPEVVPMTGYGKATPVPGFEQLYQVDLGVEILFSWLSVEYSIYHYHRPPYRTDWAHAKGEFDINSGFWRFIPVDQGRRTMTFYSVYSLPRQAAIQELYKNEPSLELMTNVATAIMVVRAVKQQAEKNTAQKLPPLKENKTVEQILLDDPETMRVLSEKGKILVLEDGPTVYVTSGTVVNAPVEKAFEVVSNFMDYPNYLPGVKKVEFKGKNQKGEPVYYQETQIKIWELDFLSKETNQYAFDPPNRISWDIQRANAGTAPGYWRFIPLDQNTKSLIFNGYTVDIRAMGMVPRTALKLVPTLEHGLLGAVTAAAMDAYKKRIEKNGLR